MMLPLNTALVLIDIQIGIDAYPDDAYDGPRNNPDAEQNMLKLLKAWRETGRPVYFIKHNSTDPNSLLRPELPTNALKDGFEPMGDEALIEKKVHSAFIGTDLAERLSEAKTEYLVIVGLESNHCVETTTRMAGNLGFHTYVAHDAAATYPKVGFFGESYTAEQAHNMAMANLHGEFATVLATQDVIDMLA